MKEIRNHFRTISKLIAAQADVASGTGHAPTTGRLRELIVQNFLRPHLPSILDIRSGIIIDPTGARSKQQDCIIVDNRFPIIDVGSENEGIIIAESVIATIEIKSMLNRKELLSTLDACAHTKKLKRIGEQVYTKGSAEIRIPKPYPINTYIFAYDGINLNSIQDYIAQFAWSRNKEGLVPEATCILTKGVLLRSPALPTVRGNEVIMPSLKESKLSSIQYKKDSLFAFYRKLIDDVLPLRMRIYDIDAYYASSELE